MWMFSGPRRNRPLDTVTPSVSCANASNSSDHCAAENAGCPRLAPSLLGHLLARLLKLLRLVSNQLLEGQHIPHLNRGDAYLLRLGHGGVNDRCEGLGHLRACYLRPTVDQKRD